MLGQRTVALLFKAGMNLTPRVIDLLERTTQSAKKAQQSAEKSRKKFPSPLKLKLNLDGAQNIDKSKSSLTARFERLVKKTELLATVALGANETNEETRYGAEGHYAYEGNEGDGTIRHVNELSGNQRDSPHKWERRFDTEYHGTPEKPIPYFFDEISGVSQWEVPEDFMEEYGAESHNAWAKHHDKKENGNIATTSNGPTEDQLWTIFESIDANGNGYLETSEVKAAIMLQSETLGQYINPKLFMVKFEELVSVSDYNGIDFESFKYLFQ